MSTPVVSLDDLSAFARNVLVAAGCDEKEARVTAEVLRWGDEFGRRQYGVWRLPILCKRLQLGLFKSPCELVIEDRGPSLAHIDGKNGIGTYVGRVAVDEAIERAKRHGSAVVSVAASNFSGAGGYFPYRMAEHGCLGLAFSNSFPKVAAHGGTKGVLGTNPFAFGAPRGDGTSVIVDLATSQKTGSDVTKLAELGQPLPEGFAIDSEGNWITDPKQVGKGALVPLGGAKGYAIGLTVEILCGVLSGAGISDGVKSMYKDMENPANIGHFFMAVDIGKLMPVEEFGERMEHLAGILTESEGVRLPGDARWKDRAETEAKGGVEVDETTAAALGKLAEGLGVSTPW